MTDHIKKLKQNLSDQNIDTAELEKIIKKSGKYNKVLSAISQQIYDKFNQQESELEDENKRSDKKIKKENQHSLSSEQAVERLFRKAEMPVHTKSKRVDRFIKKKNKLKQIEAQIRSLELAEPAINDEVFVITTKKKDRDIEGQIQDGLGNYNTYEKRFRVLKARSKSGKPSLELIGHPFFNPNTV